MMIIDTFICTKITREMTDLMEAYNIQILTVEYNNCEENLIVSYRANRIFESNQFKELVVLLDDVITVMHKHGSIKWNSVSSEFSDMFNSDSDYKIIEFAWENTMVKIVNDLGKEMLVSIGSSVYGDNYISKGV